MVCVRAAAACAQALSLPIVLAFVPDGGNGEAAFLSPEYYALAQGGRWQVIYDCEALGVKLSKGDTLAGPGFTAALTAALTDGVAPALDRYGTFIETRVLPSARSDEAPGLAGLALGEPCHAAPARVRGMLTWRAVWKSKVRGADSRQIGPLSTTFPQRASRGD